MPIEIWCDLLERELKIALEDLEGRSMRSVGRESRWGVSAFHPEFPSGHTEKDPQRWTLRITLLARGLSFVSSPRPGARRRPSRRLVRVGMTLLP
jgi:hypothetical protein